MSDTAAVHEAEARLRTILKTVVGGAKTQDPAGRPGGEDLSAAFAATGALEPPYDPEALCLLTELSSSLRQNVDAYVTNIDGFGHRFEPAFDFDADDADDRIADAIYLEWLAARDRGGLPADAAAMSGWVTSSWPTSSAWSPVRSRRLGQGSRDSHANECLCAGTPRS